MTAPDVSRAFAAAEAAYLEPEWECWDACPDCSDDVDCEDCEVCELMATDDWDEHEWEMRQDAREAREGL